MNEFRFFFILFWSSRQVKLILFVICYILEVSLICKVCFKWIAANLNFLGLCFAALTSCKAELSSLRLPTPERGYEKEAVWWRPGFALFATWSFIACVTKKQAISPPLPFCWDCLNCAALFVSRIKWQPWLCEHCITPIIYFQIC